MEGICEILYEYHQANPTAISEPDFEEDVLEHLAELGLKSDEDDDDEILSAIEMFHQCFMPVRSHAFSVPPKILSESAKDILREKIEYLSSCPQPAQRTKEWYEFRYNLITASNAYKAFESSQAVQNQLIYEKCSADDPLKEPDADVKVIQIKSPFTNVNSPMHWGQKYEPVSVLVYENIFGTTVGEFGCIRHREFPFLGASPDGININPFNPRYGRMLEIKNVVSREIDGIPKKEYWIQMQLQMETCDLDECDFLENKFMEYADEEAFLSDSMDDAHLLSEENDIKGIIMYFVLPGTDTPFYVYKPLQMLFEDFEEWSQEQIWVKHKEKTWIKNLYWWMEECSCVLVERNRMWFKNNISVLGKLWETVEEERISGKWTARAPNKRENTFAKETPSGSSAKFDFKTGKFISF